MTGDEGDREPGRDPEKDKVTPLRPRRPCPECGRPSARETYPFCSVRCKQIDLNRWLSGSYVLPGVEDEQGGSDEGGTE